MTTLDAVGGSFDFGRVVQRTFTVIGQNIAIFAIGALVLVAAPSCIGALIGWKAQAAGNYLSPPAMIGSLVTMIGGLALQGLVVYTAVTRLNGGSVSANTAVGAGARLLLPLLGLGIVQGLGIVLGTLLLIVPGIMLSVVWSVAAAGLVVENRGVFDSLQRSRDLTRGHRWAIFGLFVVYLILSMVIGAVVGGVGFAVGFSSIKTAAAGGATAMTPTIVVSTIVSSLVNAAQGVLGAAGVSSLYYELRTIKEGVSHDQLAAVFD